MLTEKLVVRRSWPALLFARGSGADMHFHGFLTGAGDIVSRACQRSGILALRHILHFLLASHLVGLKIRCLSARRRCSSTSRGRLSFFMPWLFNEGPSSERAEALRAEILMTAAFCWLGLLCWYGRSRLLPSQWGQ